MTIDINKLRRLVQAALVAPDGLNAEWMDRLGQFQEAVSPAAISELFDRLEAAERERDDVPDGWLRAIDEALVVTHLGVANADDSYEDAKRMLNELIGWHTDVATDPAVNGGFKLVPADAQPAPGVPEGWIQRGMAELEAIRNRPDDDTLLDDRTLIERIGKAMLAATPEAKPCP